MKFICLGYADLEKMKQYSPQKLAGLIDECFAYDGELRRGGHFIGGKALQLPDQARIGSPRPRAAVELMSEHPGVKFGPFEIRPANEEIHKIFAARAKKASE